MKFNDAADRFISDWESYGRINSAHTRAAYRYALVALAEEVGNRDPRTIGRDDIKRTLARWPHPNTQAARRAALNSFFKWTMQEGIRKDNPVDQTHPPKKRETSVYRLTLEEVQALLAAARTPRERWVINLGILAGLRNAELCGLDGKHFQRVNAIWVSKDIGKGGRERWIPVLPGLQPVWTEIHAAVPYGEPVFAGRSWKNPGVNTVQQETGKHISAHAIRKIVDRVAQRAGISAHITPHTLRHAFGDHVARQTGMRNAQFLLGHKDIGTTQIYTGAPTLDELTASVAGMSFGLPLERKVPQGPNGPNARESALSLGRVLVRLRGDLAPVAAQLREGCPNG